MSVYYRWCALSTNISNSAAYLYGELRSVAEVRNVEVRNVAS